MIWERKVFIDEISDMLTDREWVDLWNVLVDDEDRIMSRNEFGYELEIAYMGRTPLDILTDFYGEGFDPWAEWYRYNDWQGTYSSDDPLDLIDKGDFFDRLEEVDTDGDGIVSETVKQIIGNALRRDAESC